MKQENEIEPYTKFISLYDYTVKCNQLVFEKKYIKNGHLILSLAENSFPLVNNDPYKGSNGIFLPNSKSKFKTWLNNEIYEYTENYCLVIKDFKLMSDIISVCYYREIPNIYNSFRYFPKLLNIRKDHDFILSKLLLYYYIEKKEIEKAKIFFLMKFDKTMHFKEFQRTIDLFRLLIYMKDSNLILKKFIPKIKKEYLLVIREALKEYFNKKEILKIYKSANEIDFFIFDKNYFTYLESEIELENFAFYYETYLTKINLFYGSLFRKTEYDIFKSQFDYCKKEFYDQTIANENFYIDNLNMISEHNKLDPMLNRNLITTKEYLNENISNNRKLDSFKHEFRFTKVFTKLVKKENIDKRILRAFKKFLIIHFKFDEKNEISEKKTANSLKSIYTNDYEYQNELIEFFYKNKLNPPVKFYEAEFKSFNNSYIKWLFSCELFNHLFSEEFIEHNYIKIYNTILNFYSLSTEDEKIKNTLCYYIRNFANFYKCNLNNSKVFKLEKLTKPCIPNINNTNKNWNSLEYNISSSTFDFQDETFSLNKENITFDFSEGYIFD